jgi:hypothetical protein
MSVTRFLFSMSAGLACTFTGMQAHAVDLDGTFAGVVTLAQQIPHSPDPLHPASYYEGAPVAGSFSISLPDPQPFEPPGPTEAMYSDPAGTLSFSYVLKGVTYSFATAASDFGLLLFLNLPTAGNPTQTLFIQPTSVFNNFALTGPPGSLYNGLDGTTIHFDPAVAYTGRNSLTSLAADMTFYVDMTRVNFQTTSPVPEPATAALFAAGGAMLLARRLRRR